MGALRDWWLEKDEAEFLALSSSLQSQFDGLEPIPGHRVNGALTLGESIADLGGLNVALDAYRAFL